MSSRVIQMRPLSAPPAPRPLPTALAAWWGLLPALLALVALAAAPTAARADFTPATIATGSTLVPFEEAGTPAISQDGRYAVFRGKLLGVAGVWRNDLQTGEVQLVAGAFAALPGASEAEKALNAPDAAAPSVSADGRYVAFTAQGRIVPQETGNCPQVYVRDMDEPPTGPHAYTLASAPSGTSKGLIYAQSCEEYERSFPVAGAQTAPGVALSADGRKVAFEVLSESDLTTAEPATGEGPPTTPISQIAVRDLETQTTTLVSATPEGEPVPNGGAFPSARSRTYRGINPQELISAEQPTASSAAISADGSTVAWMGTNVPAQVPPAEDVIAGTHEKGEPEKEVEPLWRRVADGPSATTRRMLNEAGLDFYLGQYEESSTVSVETGTVYPVSNAVYLPPMLSADGSAVAVLSNAPTSVNLGSFALLSRTQLLPTEAYLVHVGDDPSVPPQVTPLTATPNFDVAKLASQYIYGISISPDGTRVAFNTSTTSFPLAPPTLVSPPAPENGVAAHYLYEVNVPLGTLTRVTHTFNGQAPNGEVGPVSFSADDQELVFASNASNLIYGDPTPEAPQVYLAHEIPDTGDVAAQNTGVAPPQLVPAPDWLLSATATPQPDGSLLVEAEVPAAGRLGVNVTAQLPTRASQRSARKSRRRVRHGKPGSRGTRALDARGRLAAVHVRRRRHTSSAIDVGLVTRTVAHAASVATEPSELILHVAADARYRSTIATPSGLYCLVRVTFAAPGRAPLSQELWVKLHASAPPRRGQAANHKRTTKRR